MNTAKVHVSNMTFDTNEKELEKHFSQFGEIKEIKVIVDPDTGRSRGFAFIEFESQESAEKALKSNGFELMGRNIRVNPALDRR